MEDGHDIGFVLSPTAKLDKQWIDDGGVVILRMLVPKDPRSKVQGPDPKALGATVGGSRGTFRL